MLSSPYKRSIDTVKEFADTYGFKIETIYDFRERKTDSVWIEDFSGFSKKQWDDFDYKHSDGESLREVQNRNIKALEVVLKKYRDKNIVIGSHGTALSAIINYYDKSFGYSDFLKIKSLMPWIVQLTFDNTTIKEIVKFDILK